MKDFKEKKEEVEWECGDCRGDFSCNMQGPQWQGPPPPLFHMNRIGQDQKLTKVVFNMAVDCDFIVCLCCNDNIICL